MTTKELVSCFFTDLKKYNPTNFKTMTRVDILNDPNNPVMLKSYSSVITRSLIFREKHPEISNEEYNILYFMLKIDLIASFFAEFPDGDPTDLVAFQKQLRAFVKKHPSIMQDIEKAAS